MPTIDLSILNQRQTPAFYADVFANRPAAGYIGRIFVSTDTYAFYRDNGTGWDLIGGPGTGTITGTGASGQIALWDGASTITGDTGLTYNGTDNSLTASKFIVTGGTSSDFLKGDGTLDNSAYITASALTGYVPYTGATANVDLGAFDLTADLITGATGSFTSSGGSNTFGITHTSGSGIALNISKDGNGEGLFITKGSGSGNAATINGGLVRIENNSSDAQLQIVSSSAPSVRIDNAATGATKRAGLGISTATNNFIQGSADRDFCIFNGSTAAASPILFGIYDAAAVNVQEAARISAARNFLIGTTTDSGEKLIVNGAAKITGVSYFNRGTLAFTLNPSYAGFNVYSQLQSTGDLALATGGDSNKVYITSGGSWGVGIGTTTPTRKLSVVSNTAEVMVLQGTSDTTTNNTQLRFYGSNAGADLWAIGSEVATGSTGKAFDIYNVDTATPSFRITGSTNNVLIGTTTDAGQKLQVNGTTYLNGNVQIGNDSNPFLNIANGGSTNVTSGISWLYGSGLVNGGGIEMAAPTGNSFYMIFKTRNSGSTAERMRIKENGVINLTSIPTSAAGLSSGDIYSNAGILTIVP